EFEKRARFHQCPNGPHARQNGIWLMAHHNNSRRARAGCRRTSRSSLRNVDYLKQQFHWLFPHADIFSSIRFHGNITWMPVPLVLLALCWSWSEARCVTDAFT